jgi:glycerol-3-phosphate acyltransferase PlsX
MPSAAVADLKTISIDAMGGDFGPPVVVEGVALAIARLGARKHRFLLHGDEAAINAELAKHPTAHEACAVRHTSLKIDSDEKPAQAMRRGKGSSLWNAVEAVKAGEAAAAVSGGNTGALMAISKLQLRMVSGDLDRPAIVASWPTMRGVTAVLDVGANITSDAAQLVEFAIMGSAFHHAVHGKEKPTIGLLNVGSEDEKGHDEVKQAHRLLKEGGFALDYRGFVEGSDIAKGTVDVIVTDGFTGNVALKTAEGMARFFSGLMKEALTSSLLSRLGAVIALPALKRMRARIDTNAVNGGPLLGLNGIVVKSHGGAEARGFANAIIVACDMARSDYAAEIERNLHRLADALLTSPPSEESPQ